MLTAKVLLTQGWGDFITWLEGHQASAEVFVAIAALAVTAVLIVVTITYVRAARRQADASVQMAQEARLARHARLDALKPVLDIEPTLLLPYGPPMPAQPVDDAGHLGLSASIRNEGPGPALRVAYCVWEGERIERLSKQRGVLGSDKEFGAGALVVEPLKDDTMVGAVVIQYEDVFGRRFESRFPIGEDGLPLTVDVRGPLDTTDKPDGGTQ